MSRRRHKIGKFPVYDAEYDLQKGASVIHNHRHDKGNVALAFWSESGVRDLLKQWEGTEDGLYPDPGGPYHLVSHLKAAQDALAAVDSKFQNMIIAAQRSGRFPPETMPQELVIERLACEARLDVVQEEIDLLKKELARYANRKQEEDDHLILPYGPAGSTQGADPPRSVDGQKIEWNEELGHFVICCKKSPYDGMKLPNYYVHIVRVWRDEKNRLYREAHDKANDLESSEGARKKWAEEAHRLVTGIKTPPWPPRPED